MIHDAECHIRANVNPQESVLYKEAGISIADLNRIFPDWAARMPGFIALRNPLMATVADNPVFKEAFMSGLIYAVEQIIKAKL